MKAGNGSGAVRKLSGKRKKPFQALVTVGMQIKNGKLVAKQKSLGCYATRLEARKACYDFIQNRKEDSITLAEAWEAVTDREKWKDKTEKAMEAAFKTLAPFHKKQMTDIKSPEITLISESLDGFSQSKQQNVKRCLSLCFDYCIEKDILMKNYAEFMRFRETKEKKKALPYTAYEVHMIDDPIQNILFYTGMRISELWLADITEINGHLFYDLRGKDVKNKSSQRLIPIHDKIRSMALSEPYRDISVSQYRHRYNKLMAEKGLDHTPHDCRRTFATFAKLSGMDDFYRKAILGHKQGNITDDIYTIATPDKLYDEMQKLRI